MVVEQWIYSTIGITPFIQKKILLSVVLILFFRLILVICCKLLQKVKDSMARYQLNRVIAGLIVFTGIMAVGRVWCPWVDSLAIFLGIMLGVISVSLKDVLFDLAGWAYIVWRRPFEINDWIAVGEETGEVLGIGRVQLTLIETSRWEEGKLRTGQIIHLPNGRIFREKVVNYSKGYRHIWNEFSVQLTFDSNWKKAKEIIHQIVNRYIEPVNKNTDDQVNKAARKCTVFYNKLAPEIYVEGVDDRIGITVRYLCEPDRRRIIAHAIWEELLNQFEQEGDIHFALAKMPPLSADGFEAVNDSEVVAEAH